jgi:hypothetical protein
MVREKKSPESVWLAADYHFPTTYSCRVPMSSTSSALAMPAPGPATVRLALIRTGIELFGIDYTRDELFPVIRSAEIRVRPPERVAFSTQIIRAYKGSAAGANGRLDESPVYREAAHATGPMTIYIKIPTRYEDEFCEALMAIGYWGQANSLACCVGINATAPKTGEFAMPLDDLNANRPLRQFFSCVVSEFRDARVNWDEVMPVLRPGRVDALKMEVYAWPMVICERRRGGKLLLRRSLE